LYWCSVLSIIFVRCSTPRTELLWGSNSQCDFYGDVTFAIWLCSQDVIVKMYMVFLYILVFAFCMFKTVKVSVTAECNWGDVNLLSRVGFWLMLRKMCLFVTSIPKTWSGLFGVGFCDHNLWRLHCLCYIFLTWDMFAFSLFVLR